MIDELWLVHPDAEMQAAFRRRFDGLPGVRYFPGRFEELPQIDAFVTAGNSYGIMTAGIDAAVIRRFGTELMQQVQQHIANEFLGEQPVGTAFLVATGDAAIPWIVHAPTMRTPGNIAGTDRVYNATWAALLAIARQNRLHAQTGEPLLLRIAMPAMGTGFGGVAFDEAARQMAAAYRHLQNPPYRLDWDWVAERELTINYDNGRKVVR
ncbi:macro domain-containing protein [Tuwongella immobilis]|uniref:Macro domain-containing protein n=1 Tax=Tuwongella immobilis TaxID=692036 RepID=A0A6C2YWB3_9BACT|nr:macro domain-containing protein [Tuwongella immobilis]VIP05152.1 Appr-1-p processing enzyme family protein OS=Rhodopirellula sp. SWK7 GN=RRSWK_05616 PE=4 SV=1: Macro [Tuwongella immobilis]VTS07660.1 Appr-1-p processing enzyme family protein OS=Rhodopirellula sp. SWK7 GN=RRSWK_05616 PE=4 SV=1: Macro [Tuwongella immobilis]